MEYAELQQEIRRQLAHLGFQAEFRGEEVRMQGRRGTQIITAHLLDTDKYLDVAMAYSDDPAACLRYERTHGFAVICEQVDEDDKRVRRRQHAVCFRRTRKGVAKLVRQMMRYTLNAVPKNPKRTVGPMLRQDSE